MLAPPKRARDDRQHSGRPERGAGPELAATVVLAVWRRRPVDPDAAKITFKEHAEHWATRTRVRPWTPTGITTAFRPGDHGATANVISRLEASD
jgi:hypothetical protein